MPEGVLRLSTSFILGYHGCDEEVAESLLSGERFRASENDYDWLGHGVYFWESNPKRGLEFAAEFQARRGHAIKPAVVGAVIDLGACLDLISSSGLQAIEAAYESFRTLMSAIDLRLPENRGGSDLLVRNLDCAVINHLHRIRETAGLAPCETVRGVFLEGEPLYPGAGFRRKTHIQICVRNLECIKAVFRVPRAHLA